MTDTLIGKLACGCDMMLNMKKKCSISEEDVSLLLQRYTATTILALLQEVAQFGGVKIDWNTLVKKTSTGISDAREYQMLWRHLAYHDLLAEKLEDKVEPLDDDSDLEVEVEAFPAVSIEASTDAAACVKVLIASGMPNDSGPTNHSTVEAALTINIPKNDQTSHPHSDNQQSTPRSMPGMNITIPVSVQKQPLPAAEGLDGNGSVGAGIPARRKRKLWTAEEDMELIAAVQKCGEGNWANILKGDFTHDRTASQLSQRWAIIRKRQATSNSGNVGNATGSALSEAQLAARQAVSIALNMPMGNLSSTSSVATAMSSTPCGSSKLSVTPQEATTVSTPQSETRTSSVAGSLQPLQQSPRAPNQGILQRGVVNPAAKSRPTPKKLAAPLKASTGPNPMVQAAAVAAGARIAPASTAASLFKAAQSRNAVHIRPGAGGAAPIGKSSLPGGPKQLNANPVGPRPSNVHYIRTSLTSSPPVYSGTVPSVQRSSGQQVVQNSCGKPGAAGQAPPSGPAMSSNLPPQQEVPEPMAVSPQRGNANADLADKSESNGSNAAPVVGVDSLSIEGGAKELVRESACLPMEGVENQIVGEKGCENGTVVGRPGGDQTMVDGDPTMVDAGEDQRVVEGSGSERSTKE